MLSEETRIAILQMHERGSGLRFIARALNVGRATIRKVLASGSPEVPALNRPSQADPWHEEILQEHARLKGRLVLVHRTLASRGATLSYQALTAYCRRHGIGVKPKVPSGSYTFEPAEEMQFDTSPHRVKVGGRERMAQCASLVLAHSRMRVHAVLPDLRPVLVQGVPHRGPGVFRRGLPALRHRQHQRDRGRGDRRRDDPGAGDGGLRPAVRVRVQGPRRGPSQPQGARGTKFPVHRIQLPPRSGHSGTGRI